MAAKKQTIELTADWDYRPDVLTTIAYKAGKKYPVDAEVAEAAKKSGKLKGKGNGEGSGAGSTSSGSGGSES